MELYNSFVEKWHENTSPIVKAILKECCESVENSPTKVEQPELSAYIAFKTCLSLIISSVEAFSSEEETINLNYQGHSFQVSRSSQHWKQLKAIQSALADLTF